MDLLLREPSLVKSITIGARVAPPSPVGWKIRVNLQKHLSSFFYVKLRHCNQIKRPQNVPKQDAQLDYSIQQIYLHPDKYFQSEVVLNSQVTTSEM